MFESPQQGSCQVVIVKLFYDFLEKVTESSPVVTKFPILSLQCWTCMVSGSVMWHTFCFLAIYKFNTPAFCVLFVFLRKVLGLQSPGAWHVETTLQAHVFINHLPLVLFRESPAPCHTVIPPTFLHFDLKSVSCLESFNRYCKSIRENEASNLVLLTFSHLSWRLVVSASFISFLFF